ncbi:hypothetical protein BC831DRAFT_463371 [Entophlyctis helioformis]|nr:hypothetical protein BC831DRAFT_463371 [Entophlyctis helioformis]
MDGGDLQPVSKTLTMPRRGGTNGTSNSNGSGSGYGNSYGAGGSAYGGSSSKYSTGGNDGGFSARPQSPLAGGPGGLASWIPSDPWARTAIGWSLAQLLLVGILEVVLAANHSAYVADIGNQKPGWPSVPAIGSSPGYPSKDLIYNNGRAITVYHGLFVCGLVFQFVMAYDAIFNMSVIQLVTTSIFNWSLAIYSIVQSSQAANLLDNVPARLVRNVGPHPTTTTEIIIMVVMFVFAVGWVYLSYQLYKVFGWTLFKEMGADINVRNQLMVYHVYLLLLKLDVFFFLGFSFQFLFLVLTTQGSTTDFILHAAVATPGTVVLLALAYFAIRRESKVLMITTMVGLLGGGAYLVSKLVDVYSPANEAKYSSSKRSITFFIILALLMTAATLVSAFLNYLNFGKGLMDQLNSRSGSGSANGGSGSRSGMGGKRSPSGLELNDLEGNGHVRMGGSVQTVSPSQAKPRWNLDG